MAECPSCYTFERYSRDQTFASFFVIKNTGNIEAKITNITVDQRGCEGCGFKIVGCGTKMEIKPDSYMMLEIVYTPTTGIRDNSCKVYIHTSTKVYDFKTHVDIPFLFLDENVEFYPDSNIRETFLKAATVITVLVVFYLSVLLLRYRHYVKLKPAGTWNLKIMDDVSLFYEETDNVAYSTQQSASFSDTETYPKSKSSAGLVGNAAGGGSNPSDSYKMSHASHAQTKRPTKHQGPQINVPVSIANNNAKGAKDGHKEHPEKLSPPTTKEIKPVNTSKPTTKEEIKNVEETKTESRTEQPAQITEQVNTSTEIAAPSTHVSSEMTSSRKMRKKKESKRRVVETKKPDPSPPVLTKEASLSVKEPSPTNSGRDTPKHEEVPPSVDVQMPLPRSNKKNEKRLAKKKEQEERKIREQERQERRSAQLLNRKAQEDLEENKDSAEEEVEKPSKSEPVEEEYTPVHNERNRPSIHSEPVPAEEVSSKALGEATSERKISEEFSREPPRQQEKKMMGKELTASESIAASGDKSPELLSSGESEDYDEEDAKMKLFRDAPEITKIDESGNVGVIGKRVPNQESTGEIKTAKTSPIGKPAQPTQAESTTKLWKRSTGKTAMKTPEEVTKPEQQGEPSPDSSQGVQSSTYYHLFGDRASRAAGKEGGRGGTGLSLFSTKRAYNNYSFDFPSLLSSKGDDRDEMESSNISMENESESIRTEDEERASWRFFEDQPTSQPPSQPFPPGTYPPEPINRPPSGLGMGPFGASSLLYPPQYKYDTSFGQFYMDYPNSPVRAPGAQNTPIGGNPGGNPYFQRQVPGMDMQRIAVKPPPGLEKKPKKN